MSHARSRHSQSGQTLCGGKESVTGKSCLKFQSGSWVNMPNNMVFNRYGHSSWEKNGDILLIGGHTSDSYTTTEIVHQNGSISRSFDLKHVTESSCTIELP